jgi:hypothetical protein
MTNSFMYCVLIGSCILIAVGCGSGRFLSALGIDPTIPRGLCSLCIFAGKLGLAAVFFSICQSVPGIPDNMRPWRFFVESLILMAFMGFLAAVLSPLFLLARYKWTRKWLVPPLACACFPFLLGWTSNTGLEERASLYRPLLFRLEQMTMMVINGIPAFILAPIPKQAVAAPDDTIIIDSMHCTEDMRTGCFGGPLKLGPKVGIGARKGLRPVLEPFYFVDSKGEHWKVEAGFLTDGATIPELFQRLMGSSWREEYLRAAVLYDSYIRWHENCKRPMRVHEMFREVLLASGVTPGRAETMYRAVVTDGPWWTKKCTEIENEEWDEAQSLIKKWLREQDVL